MLNLLLLVAALIGSATIGTDDVGGGGPLAQPHAVMDVGGGGPLP